MTNIKIFTNRSIEIDLNYFIDSRCLICANSGAGKSYVIRKILEESYKKVLSVVLDMEGEFHTLREKYDFLLIGGSNGDLTLNLKVARLLPKKILELNVSTILDLSELKKKERIQFVKEFLEGLMELPKEYYKPLMVILDEAHHFAGEQEKQDSTWAVIDLMTRGRKRGYEGVLATQRIAKLHKDAVAECNNVMVGRTFLDIDMKRASDILGFTNKKDMLSLRELNAGEFYVFGTAFPFKGIEKIQVSKAKTTHPKVGMKLNLKISTPTEKIKKILAKLTELPKQAEIELKTAQDYKNEISRLKFELRKKEQIKIQPIANHKKIEQAKIEGESKYKKSYNELEFKYVNLIKEHNHNIEKSNEIIKLVDSLFSAMLKTINYHSKQIKDLKLKTKILVKPQISQPQKIAYESKTPPPRPKEDFIGEPIKLREGAYRILKAVAMFDEITKEKARTMSGISSLGTFGTYIADLQRAGWITREGNNLKITDEGRRNCGEIQELPTTTEEFIELWSKFFRQGTIRILKLAVEVYPNSISKEELQEKSGIASNGTFGTYLAELKRNNLVKVEDKEVTASKELFE